MQNWLISWNTNFFKNGYKTIICNSEHDSEKEREYIEMLEANQVDGIISGSHNLGIEDYNRVTAPIISFDRNLSPDIPVVSSDNYAGGVLAAQTLVKTGAQSIIMITGNDNSNSPTGLRHAGFASVLPKAPIINVSSDFSPVRKEMEIKNILTHQNQMPSLLRMIWLLFWSLKLLRNWEFLYQKSSRSSVTMVPTLSRITTLNWLLLSNPWKRLPASLLTSSCKKSKARRSRQLVTFYQLLFCQEKVFKHKKTQTEFVWVFYDLKFSK